MSCMYGAYGTLWHMAQGPEAVLVAGPGGADNMKVMATDSRANTIVVSILESFSHNSHTHNTKKKPAS